MIRIYLNMAWKLLQKNLLSIVIFETVYRLFSSQLVSRLANAAINFSLKQLGTSYMTSENFNKIMLHPLTLLLILEFCLFSFSVCCLKSMLSWRLWRPPGNENGFPFLS